MKYTVDCSVNREQKDLPSLAEEQELGFLQSLLTKHSDCLISVLCRLGVYLLHEAGRTCQGDPAVQ
jgi:hypothetical protein